MNLVIGVLCLWLAAALLWVASHGLQQATPWGVYQQILKGLGGGQP